MNEHEIKESLIRYLSNRYSSENNEITFIKELFVDSWNRRADVVMVNGHLSAYEIKSDRDSLTRLRGQLDSFKNYFEYVTVVCTKTYISEIKKILGHDEWLKVGIFLVDGENVQSIRKAKKNVIKIDNWFSHLPVDELRKLLKENAVHANGNRAELINAASKHLLVKHVREFVLRYFKRRDEKIQAMKKKGNRLESRLPKISLNDELIKSYKNAHALTRTKLRIPRQVIHPHEDLTQ